MINQQAFANLILSVEESPNACLFTMERYGHSCGTPACVIGHYAYRTDLQDVFALDGGGELILQGASRLADYDSDAIMVHFGISYGDAQDLFGSLGCNEAQTPAEAIAFIKQWLAARVAMERVVEVQP